VHPNHSFSTEACNFAQRDGDQVDLVEVMEIANGSFNITEFIGVGSEPRC